MKKALILLLSITVMALSAAAQDIDTMEDWKLMEMKYDLLHQKD